MNGYATVGQPAAVAAVRAMLATRVPHAILLAGPASVGKLPLAMDLAAALLCTGADGGRPAVSDVPRLPDGGARQPSGPAPPGA